VGTEFQKKAVSRQFLYWLRLDRLRCFTSSFAILRKRTKTGPRKARASNLLEKDFERRGR
jgi:hypothetical protein